MRKGVCVCVRVCVWGGVKSKGVHSPRMYGLIYSSYRMHKREKELYRNEEKERIK